MCSSALNKVVINGEISSQLSFEVLQPRFHCFTIGVVLTLFKKFGTSSGYRSPSLAENIVEISKFHPLFRVKIASIHRFQNRTRG